jgi:predicted acyl esterase
LYIIGGWYDELRDQGAITLLNVPGSRLLIGPWKHCANDGFPLVEEAHRFFDHHLKGTDTGLTREPAVHYWTVNGEAGNQWRAADSWPVAGVVPERWLLAGDGALVKPGRARASYRRPTDFKVRYDVNCVNGGIGPDMQPCHLPGAGASFAEPALASDREVTGSGVADLWISADAADTNLFAYLEDVAPDGTVRVVTEGRQKASLRATHDAPWKMPAGIPWHRSYAEDAKPLKAGEPVRVVFELMPVSWVFKAGHRMQLTVTGADWRERARDQAALATVVRIYSDSARPSSITLPSVRRR